MSCVMRDLELLHTLLSPPRTSWKLSHFQSALLEELARSIFFLCRLNRTYSRVFYIYTAASAANIRPLISFWSCQMLKCMREGGLLLLNRWCHCHFLFWTTWVWVLCSRCRGSPNRTKYHNLDASHSFTLWHLIGDTCIVHVRYTCMRITNIICHMTADTAQPRKCSLFARPFSSWEGRVWGRD